MDSFETGGSLGDIDMERDREAKNLFLRISAEGGSSEDLDFVGRLRPMRPLREEEDLDSPFVRGGRKTGTAVRGVPGDVGGRARGTELME